jgi:hypothetical protein
VLATIEFGIEYARDERATVPVPVETFGTSQFGKPAELGSSKSSQSDGAGLMLAQNGPPEEEPDDDPLLEPEPELEPELDPEPELEPDPELESLPEPASDAPFDREATFKHPSQVAGAKKTSHHFDFHTTRKASTFTPVSSPIGIPRGRAWSPRRLTEGDHSPPASMTMADPVSLAGAPPPSVAGASPPSVNEVDRSIQRRLTGSQ